MGWRGRLLWVQLDFVARKPCSEKILLEIGDLINFNLCLSRSLCATRIGAAAGLYINKVY